MKLKKQKLVYSFLIIFFLSGSQEYALSQSKKIRIQGGNFIPLFQSGEEKKPQRVDTFFMGAYPVTNDQFYTFVQKNPMWQKNSVSVLSAESEYLKHWREGKPLKEHGNKPVTYVSWFAAHAYCEWEGGRLPNVLEWEYVARANEKKKNASTDEDFIKQLLGWYSKPFDFEKMSEVGASLQNIWGVYDMHGLVWEWNYDFNSVFVTSDSRQDKDVLNSLFCGAGAMGASDKKNYAAFMRYALRSSLKAHYTLSNLGFRCVYSDNVAR
ncbi:MAG: formylglycine-generating enzyme family protein [Deltaproteobacteria bacterium]|nr:formylglycine-generating enzyme family protein [Deltaproteobacteria bacterium]